MLASRCYITSASQHTSVINSHHLHYSRLWNNVHQVSSLTLCAVLTWADMWHRKSSQIPCHRKSLSSPPPASLSPSPTHRLSIKPTSSHALTFLPVFSVWLQYFLVLDFFFGLFFGLFYFSLCCFFYSPAGPLCSLTSTEKQPEGFVKSLFVDGGQLSSGFFVYYTSWRKVHNRSPASAAICLILYWYAYRSWVWTVSRAKISHLSPSSNSSSIVQQVNLA